MPIREKWIRNGIDEEAIQWANQLGQRLTQQTGDRKALSASQIRKFFGELKRIQTDPIHYQNDIPLLKAKLAYAVGRVASKNRDRIVYNTKIKDFYDEIIPGIDFIRPNEKRDFNNFVKLIEAIVAYHKYYGGV